MKAMRTIVGLALIWSALFLSSQDATAQSPDEEQSETQTFHVYVPMAALDGPGGSGEVPAECNLNEQEADVAALMENHPEQQRATPVCDPVLAQVARARARDMALRNYLSHTNPDGDGPNLLAREAGYPLPDWYSDAQDANNIESIGGGYPTPERVWQGWLDSSGHRRHVLGTDPFYGGQDSYGIGYYFNPDSRFGHYWVFISAPTVTPEE